MMRKPTKLICKLLSLPYLPPEHRYTIFTLLHHNATTQPLQELTTYISSIWLQSTIWSTAHGQFLGATPGPTMMWKDGTS